MDRCLRQKNTRAARVLFSVFLLLDKSSICSVYLGVCPVQFAVYLRLRAVGYIKCCSQIIFTKLVEEYLEHAHANTCKCNYMVKSGGSTTVLIAFLNYSSDNKLENIRLYSSTRIKNTTEFVVLYSNNEPAPGSLFE